jgi:hypothetical protein
MRIEGEKGPICHPRKMIFEDQYLASFIDFLNFLTATGLLVPSFAVFGSFFQLAQHSIFIRLLLL